LKYASYLQADITKPYQLPDADLCIHTAALSDDKATLKDLLVANENGTKNTLVAAQKCKMFIHISSSSVYLPSNKLLTEEMAGKQNNHQLSDYGLSKLKAEEILFKTTSHQTCFVLRPRALYGPGDKVILPRLLKLVKNEKLQCPGKLEINISMTHYDNLINAIECCMDSTQKGIHVYNVSDDKTYLFIDVIRKITKSLYDKSLPEIQIPVAVLKFMSWFKLNGITKLLVRGFTQDMVLDISKIKRELNYRPVTDLDKSLPELKTWVSSIGGNKVIKKGDKALAWK
jgi:nucleoside-diphosphate-sugar epimerase